MFAKTLQNFYLKFTKTLSIKVRYYFEIKIFFDKVHKNTGKLTNASSLSTILAENTYLIINLAILLNLPLLLSVTLQQMILLAKIIFRMS